MKILAITNTIEFQNRATFEAISQRYGCLDVLVKRHLKDIFKKKIVSDKLSVYYVHSLVPASLQKYPLFELLELTWLNSWLRRYKVQYDIFLFCNTHVAHMTSLFNGKKRLALFVDPYTLMSNGKSTSQEKRWVRNTDAVLCTSRALADHYIRRHLSINRATTYYWPNTVDLSQWQYNEKTDDQRPVKTVCGYSGNMNEITIDLALLDRLTDCFEQVEFRFAGRVNFRLETDAAAIYSIFRKNNVKYLGFIPYARVAEEVSRWNLCLMLDRQDELSTYVHHNKVYQYLALGKPVVATKTHDDYLPLLNVLYLAETHTAFIDLFDRALKERHDPALIQRRRERAQDNSAYVRAKQFMTIVKQHYKNKRCSSKHRPLNC